MASATASVASICRVGDPGRSASTQSGSGIRFGESRDVELHGVEGSRLVLPVVTEGATPEAVRRLAIEQSNLLRREGEYWTVAYDGQVATIRDTKGLRDLARLLAAPGRELHVLDLAAEANTSGAVADQPLFAEGVTPGKRR